MSKVMAAADFIQTDVTYGENKFLPCLFNATVFEALLHCCLICCNFGAKANRRSSVSSRGLLQLVYYQSMGGLVDKAIPLGRCYAGA